ncbi:MAG: GIY-YIG nuclease family protein [Verrucomicrobiales bacterium]|nr:GIY-YIG nuclease family protein [Verrucomicrobiales bacterium]
MENVSGRRYIGLSADVSNRLSQHKAGESTWTKGKGPWNLVWQSREMTLGEARKLENKMKRQKGGAGLRTLMDTYGS